MINTAILLSAGFGKRLHPLTQTTPKCLLPVGGKALIVYHIEKLAQLNIRNIIINTAYLGHQIQAYLGNGDNWDVKITYSVQTEPLEVGGGIFKALPLLGEQPFLAISSDIFTDYDFSLLQQPKFMSCFLKNKLQAHLILAPNPDYHPEGDFGLAKNNLLTKLSKKLLKNNSRNNYTYANIALLSAGLFENIAYKPGEKFQIAPLFHQAIQQQRITGELYRGIWYNIGTLAEYQKACEYAKICG